MSPITVHVDLLEPLYPDNYDVLNDISAFWEHQFAIVAEYDPEDPTVRREDLEGTIEAVDRVIGTTQFARLGLVNPHMREFGQYAMEFFQTFDYVAEEHEQVPLKGIKRDRPDWVAVYMGLIRYRGQPGQENRNTDIVVYVSVPHIPGLVKDFTRDDDDDDDEPETIEERIEERRKIPLVQKGRFILDRILQTFDIVDESLLAT